MQLSIIIVNYNVKYFLEHCLSSVIKAIKDIDAEIFVVDNNSTDGSKEFFLNRFSQVQFIWKKENVGFAKANNEALRLTKGDKILFLNPDTIIPEDCFEKCLPFFSTAKNIGSLGVRMIDGSGKYLPESKRGFPSSFTSFCKMTGLTKLFPSSKLFTNYYLGHLSENEINEIDVLPGAFMMIDKKVLDKTGGFDEDFFMYGEDIDLSYRIQNAGFKNYYFPLTTIIHFKGESTQKESENYIRNFYGAMLLFVKKHYGKFQAGLYSLMIRTVLWSKIIFRKKSVTQKGKFFPSEVFVLSDAGSFSAIENNVKKFFTEVKRVDYINAADIEESTVIFCEPFISFNEMIVIMDQYQNKNNFLIHAAGTRSIVGSFDKNKTGDFIIIE